MLTLGSALYLSRVLSVDGASSSDSDSRRVRVGEPSSSLVAQIPFPLWRAVVQVPCPYVLKHLSQLSPHLFPLCSGKASEVLEYGAVATLSHDMFVFSFRLFRSSVNAALKHTT